MRNILYKNRLFIIENIGKRCDKSINDKDADQLMALVIEIDKAIIADSSVHNQAFYRYYLGNLHSSLSNIKLEHSAGWRGDNYPNHLTHAINNYRKAYNYFKDIGYGPINEIITNLANSLANQRRNIEALENWKCDFSIQGDAPFVSSLSKARELLWLGNWISDPTYVPFFQYESYKIAKYLQNNLSNSTNVSLNEFISTNKEIKGLIEFGDNNFKDYKNWDKANHYKLYSKEEYRYRRWCLDNRLFVNYLNDITTNWIADQDILQFPNYTVDVNEGPYYMAAFSSIKREYCFARFMAFEGLNKQHPEYENQKLFLVDTEDCVDYYGSTEKLKASLRICFSVFDSLATLMNQYFACGSKKPTFKSNWILENLKNKGNHFIDALYWLACDLADKDIKGWKAPEPGLSEIRKIRNSLEHGWLRVSEFEYSIWDRNTDFAHILSLENLQQTTLSLLKLVRSAMIYLCLAVKINEDLKTNNNEDLKIKAPIYSF